MDRQSHVSRLAVVTALILAAGGCALFGGGGGEEVGGPEPTADTVRSRTSPDVSPEAAAPSDATMEDLLAAGDYAGALTAFAADTALHADEDALYMAALAAAMAGHAGHDSRRAARLFERLLELHPATERRHEAELYLALLAQERALRMTIDRLDRELRQLKAIDLGREPEGANP